MAEALLLLRALSKEPDANTERQCLALTLVALGQLSSDDGDAAAS